MNHAYPAVAMLIKVNRRASDLIPIFMRQCVSHGWLRSKEPIVMRVEEK